MAQFLTAIDLTNNQIKNVLLEQLSSAPGSPLTGRIYYDTTLGFARIWNGSAWTKITDAWISNVAGTAPIQVSVVGGVATVSILAATSGQTGSMSSADKAKLDAATNLNTPSTLVLRDSSGNFSAGTITAALTGTASNATQLNGQPDTYYLNRANHTGTQLASTISNFDTQVRTSRLDQMAVPTSAVSFNSQNITNVADPINPQDVATRNYVDAARVGLDVKLSVRAGTTANVTLAGSAPNVTDGVTLALNDRILVKNQTTGSQNGIYTVTTLGTGSNGTWTRATDADTSAKVTSGMFTFISEGTTLATSGWILQTPDPITLGTTSLTFTQFTGGSTYTAGSGLNLAGNVFSVVVDNVTLAIVSNQVQIKSTYVGQTSITTVGTITSGTWNGTAIGTAYGGTGATTIAGAKTNLGFLTRYATNIGDGTTTSYTVTHNLGTQDVTVTIYRNSAPFDVVYADVQLSTTNTVTLIFGTAPTTNQFRVLVTG